jgi:hypothetical protein
MRLPHLIAWVLSIFVFLVSVYVIWGWVTTWDLRRYCKDRGLEYDKVAGEFLNVGSISFESQTNSGPSIVYDPREPNPFDRVSFSWQALIYDGSGTNSATGSSTTLVLGSFLTPFVAVSENFLNLLYCFALGSFISFLLLLVGIYNKKLYATRVILMKPLLGGLCSACLYLLSIAASDLIFEQRGSFRFGSLPAIALLGVFSVERFDRLLKMTLKKGEG